MVYKPRPMKDSYAIAEECWINVPYCDDEGRYCEARVKGHVEFWYHVPDCPERRFVIRVDSHDFPHLETRDVYTMAPSEEALMPFARPRVSPPEPEPTPPPGAEPLQ